MTLTGEQFGAVESERFDADQDFAAVRRGDREALNLENLRPTCFMDHCDFHRGHHWGPYISCVRRIGSREAVTRYLPLPVGALPENEELLVRFRAPGARRVESGRSCRVGTREGPVG